MSLILSEVAMGLVLGFAPGHAEDDFRNNETARIFDLQDTSKLLFMEKRTVKTLPSGRTEVTIESLDPKGDLALKETIEYEKGKVARYRAERTQIGAKGTIVVSKGKAKFEYRMGGEIEKDEEDFTDQSVVADQIDDRIRENWDRLQKKGESLKLDLMLVNQLKSIGFIITKGGDARSGGKAAVVYKMSPSSPFISLLLSSAEIHLEKAKPHRRLQYVGRKFLKYKRRGKWEDLDAKAVYDVP